MKTRQQQPTVKEPKSRTQTVAPAAELGVPPPEAFLEEAKHEAKRKLIADHINTIKHLRDEKRFTFREIAEWLNKRGLECDHSAVYRAYLSAIPEDQRDPHADWSGLDDA